jgi:hypothetical protein
MSYDNGGWFICEMHDYEYKHKTNKQIFITVPCKSDKRGMLSVNPDPEVQAYLKEVDEVNRQLYEELIQIAIKLKLNIYDWDGNKYKKGDKISYIILEDEDGKILTKTLIDLGWEKQFIPIGP